MGLPEIIIDFNAKAASAITRSSRGIVAVILKDDTQGGKALNTYQSILDVDFAHWSERNYEYLKLIFAGSPSRVIALRAATADGEMATELAKLQPLKWHYLTVPSATPAEATTIATWIKERRDQEHKIFKAVLSGQAADHEGIINCTTDNISSTYSTTVSWAAEYCARIAGVLAGLPLTRSSTYYLLEDITAADIPADPDARIDKGELVIVYDSEHYKIGRGVNSLVTYTDGKNVDMSKIKIIEGMDLYQDDIRSTFENDYVGQVVNDYDAKQALVATIAAYQRELQGDVLDREYDNTVAVDLEAQRKYLETVGVDTSEMDEVALAKANTGSKVFLTSRIKFVDAMEDLVLSVNM